MVGQQQAPELLSNQGRCLAAHHDVRTLEGGLDLSKRCFDSPVRISVIVTARFG
jgi:hypothetical protein